MTQPSILKIVVPGPFANAFDYLPPEETSDVEHLTIGMRVLVPFGKRKLVGVLVQISQESSNHAFKLRHVLAILDSTPVFDAQMLEWLYKISLYYHHPLGETLLTAMPVLLRQGKHAQTQAVTGWRINSQINLDESLLQRAPKQLEVYRFLRQQQTDITLLQIEEQIAKPQTALKELLRKNLICKTLIAEHSRSPVTSRANQAEKILTDEQTSAIKAMQPCLDSFKVILLNGVTGSGKTDVYINISRQIIARGKQVLILLPEIALTPQIVSRFRNQFNCTADVLHSGLNDTERLIVWENIRSNKSQILIGTRSAIFSPFASLGLIVIDEEHDLSFKQQDGLRYSTRDIALLKAKQLSIPVILGSATPSLESIANTRKPHYLHLHLKQRAGKAIPPTITTCDIKGRQLTEGLSSELIAQIKMTLVRGEQVLLFLNQRGYAPALICHQCGEVEKCPRCDRNMTIHHARRRITCHHCGHEKPLPDKCNHCGQTDLRPIGYGTERIEKCLHSLFPDIEVIRIDRDTTSRKNAIHDLLNRIDNNKPQILLGTQMLAKGHDFPNVTLVGILNADQGLFGADLRSEERLAQLIIQVAGRAGRGEKPGKVIIQTHHPEHKLWQTLMHHTYDDYAESALEERKQARLPPFSFSALFRSESANVNDTFLFLTDVRKSITEFQQRGLEIFGPVSAPMERKAGKYRTQLLLMSENREVLHQCISVALKKIENLKSAKKIRWNLDIDPLDMS